MTETRSRTVLATRTVWLSAEPLPGLSRTDVSLSQRGSEVSARLIDEDECVVRQREEAWVRERTISKPTTGWIVVDSMVIGTGTYFFVTRGSAESDEGAYLLYLLGIGMMVGGGVALIADLGRESDETRTFRQTSPSYERVTACARGSGTRRFIQLVFPDGSVEQSAIDAQNRARIRIPESAWQGGSDLDVDVHVDGFPVRRARFTREAP